MAVCSCREIDTVYKQTILALSELNNSLLMLNSSLFQTTMTIKSIVIGRYVQVINLIQPQNHLRS